jgi:protease I
MAHILFLLPQTEFDPTEVAVPWKAWSDAGHNITFATETGNAAVCDQITLTGKGLPILARSMVARQENRTLYDEMAKSAAYRSPKRWADVRADDYDAFHFPGGHAPGMKPYLESLEVRDIARGAFAANKPVAAICHGVVLLARAGVLQGRKTTALNNKMEGLAVFLTKGALGNHYRTYPESVEDEVRGLLGHSGDFDPGPTIPRFASATKPDVGFVVEDGNYVSARWPGDAWTLAKRMLTRLK